MKTISVFIALSISVVITSTAFADSCEKIEFQELDTFSKEEIEKEFCKDRRIAIENSEESTKLLLAKAYRGVDSYQARTEACLQQLDRLSRIYEKKFGTQLKEVDCSRYDESK